MTRRIFIGDIHGHYNALMQLLDAIAPDLEDSVYFVGDLIDRGPQSAQVVEFVMKNNYPCILGNHEQMLLDILEDPEVPHHFRQAWLYSGGQSTIESYGDDGIPSEHLQWFQNLPYYRDLGDVWLVHAGVHPDMPLEEQSTDQFCWIRDEFHTAKEPFFTNKLIITGHTITFTLPGVQPGKLAHGPGWLDIDTGAYHRQSGWLTGLDLTNRKVYQVHTSQKSLRTLSLETAITKVDPSKLMHRRIISR
ncbi:serine/threonine protein phosphatase [Lusitaniella coriacea LEGE 07157]|uniref:Serine/threonine protein phosphatase n=1 Tax=Lusitaniella coriacea LEGE 07157 TaxID=945747 RepID=A0A8J7DZF7_9CYAN|nr:metallophosphoesterase family protein [Lusitaniella coriacea]MBE9118178.1 serine/threonine protein phosphatase [Lusitaniella coriacea LEGE 07157]